MADKAAEIGGFALDEDAVCGEEWRVECKIHRSDTGALGLVYFIRAGQSKMVKIGWTTDLRVRLSGLQSGNDKPLRVLLALSASRDFEATLHSQFRRWRRIGEWFWLDDEIMQFVADHLTECVWRKDPTKVRFMATPRSLPAPSMSRGR